MPPPKRQELPTDQAGLRWVITDDGSRTLMDERLDETFHSGCGAVSESLVTYLLHSGIAKRLRQAESVRVLEVGFGTGTAFQLTAALAEHYGAQLEYVALDNRLLSVDILQSLSLEESVESLFASQSDYHGFSIGEFSQLPNLLQAFLKEYASVLAELERCADATPTFHELEVSRSVRLKLLIGDANSDLLWPAADKASLLEPASFDSVYFDPFSPESAPELWTNAMFTRIASVLKPNGTLCSYCVKGDVRRRLAACGFHIQKLPGPLHGKREVMLAALVDSSHSG